MPITFKCKCGQAFQVKDELAGKQAQCHKCKEVLTIPQASAVSTGQQPQLQPLGGQPQLQPLGQQPNQGQPQLQPLGQQPNQGQPQLQPLGQQPNLGQPQGQPQLQPLGQQPNQGQPQGQPQLQPLGQQPTDPLGSFGTPQNSGSPDPLMPFGNSPLGNSPQLQPMGNPMGSPMMNPMGNSAPLPSASLDPLAVGGLPSSPTGGFATPAPSASQSATKTKNKKKRKKKAFTLKSLIDGESAISQIMIPVFILSGIGLLVAAGMYGYLAGALILIGVCLSIVGAVMLLMIAAQESAIQVLLILVVPFYGLIYAITRWEEAGVCFLMSICGFGLTSCGTAMIESGMSKNPFKPEETIREYNDPPRRVLDSEIKIPAVTPVKVALQSNRVDRWKKPCSLEVQSRNYMTNGTSSQISTDVSFHLSGTHCGSIPEVS